MEQPGDVHSSPATPPDAPATPLAAWRQRLPLALVASAGLILSGVLHVLVRDAERRRLAAEFERRADGPASALQRDLDDYLSLLHSINAFFYSSHRVDRQEFQGFTRDALARLGGMVALEWIPRVANSDRSSHEQAAREEGFAQYEILDRDHHGRAVRAPVRGEYLPVFYAEPASRRSELGLDLGAQPDHVTAMNQARDQGIPVAGAPFRRDTRSGGELVCRMFVAVYTNLVAHETVIDRFRNVAGYGSALIDLEQLVSATMRRLRLADTRDIAWELVDETSAEGPPFPIRQSATWSAVAAREGGIEASLPCEFAGRQWLLKCRPTPDYLAARPGWGAWGLLAAGVVMTALLTAYLWSTQGRAAQVERMVIERTAELARSNQELTAEIAGRQRAQRRLAVQYAVARTLAEAETFPAAAPHILREVCECIGWDLGAVWELDRQANVLRCVELWHAPSVNVPEFEAVSRRTAFRPGIGLPGRVWSTGEPAWIGDVVTDSNFPRAPFARAEGLHSAFGFPIRSGAGVLGVIEFFSRRIEPPDDELLRMLAAVGSQVGQFIERKRMEDALAQKARDLERSNRDLEQFAYVASHDLQEPLRMIASYMQLLDRRYGGQFDAPAREFISYAVDGATRMQTLIADLLAYSRVGTQSRAFAAVDSGEALQRAMKNLEVSRTENAARIDAGSLPRVKGDLTLLTQLFQNLLANAIKFRGAGPAVVHISAEPRGQGPAREWCFAVRDEGIGIDPKHFERIFVIFQRLHAREEYPGTGIGLSLCKKIVERHGGRIWVESQPGRGATFFFTLPAAEEARS